MQNRQWDEEACSRKYELARPSTKERARHETTFEKMNQDTDNWPHHHSRRRQTAWRPHAIFCDCQVPET